MARMPTRRYFAFVKCLCILASILTIASPRGVPLPVESALAGDGWKPPTSLPSRDAHSLDPLTFHEPSDSPHLVVSSPSQHHLSPLRSTDNDPRIAVHHETSSAETTAPVKIETKVLPRRQLLSISSQPISTQIADVNVPYQLPLSSIFTGNFTMLSANLQGGALLPDWLQLNYQQAGSIAGDFFTAILANDLLIASCYSECALAFYNVSQVRNPKLVGRFGNKTEFFWSFQVQQQRQQQHEAYATTTIFAAVSSMHEGFQIVDISEIHNPKLISSLPVNCNTSCVLSTAGTIAYLVGNQFGLQLIDISDHHQPKALSSLPASTFPSSLMDVVVSGNIAYVATQLDGLYLINVTDPTHLQILSVFQAADFMLFSGVTISGSTAFIPNYSEGLLIVDVSNPNNPQLVTTFQPGSSGGGVAVQQVTVAGNTAFLSNLLSAVQLVDITDLSNPQLLGTLSNNDITRTIVAERILFEVSSNGIQILDLSQGVLSGTPPLDYVNRQLELEVHARNEGASVSSVSFALILDQPPYVIISTLLDQTVFPSASLSFNINSKLIFNNPINSFLSPSLQLVNGQPAPSWAKVSITPAPISSFASSSGRTQRLAISSSKTTIFMAGGDAGLLIVDSTDQRNLQLLSTFSVNPGSVAGVAITASTAFVIADRLYIINITNLRAPVLISEFSTFSPQAITIEGNLAFVAETLINRVRVVNITDLSSPKLLSTVISSAKGMAVSGNTLFVANQYDGLQIFDITNPSRPVLLSAIVVDSFSVYSVILSGNTAFLGATFGELQIIDISNLTNPRHVSSFTTGIGALNSLTLSGHTLFAANQISGLQIFDVTDLSHPKLIGSGASSATSSSSGGVCNDVAVVGNTVFIANLNSGLQLSDLSQWQFQANAPSAASGEAGNYPLHIVATDELGEKVLSPTFTVRVEGPPMFNAPILNQYAKIGQVFTYFIPQGLCTDPNQDIISYSAALTNASLPDWIKFNSVSATFTGIPTSTDVGIFTVQINATDHIAGVVSAYFTLDVAHLPVVANPITPPSSLRVDRSFNMRIPTSTFKHPDSTLSYSAAKADGSRLPPWLQFDPTTLAFTGTPATQDQGTVNLQVIATDSYGQFISAPLSLQISFNVAPEVFQPISDQAATVGQAFVFSAPVNTFTFFPGDTPIYQANLASGADLPGWLHFDNATLTFSGTPGRVDTDPFTARSLSINLYAFNYPFVEGSFATATFHLNVGGISYPALVLSVIGPAISFATFVFALYKKRALLLNHLEGRKASYQKLAVTAVRGEVFEFLLETPSVHIHHLQVRQYKVKDRCCHCFRTSYQKLPGGLTLPSWMEYDYTSNRIRSRGPIPKVGPNERLIVQVKNEVNLITEEFQLHVEQQTTSHEDQKPESAGLAAEDLIVHIHTSTSPKIEAKQTKVRAETEMQELIPFSQTTQGEGRSPLSRTQSSPSQRSAFRLIVDRPVQITPIPSIKEVDDFSTAL